MEEEKETVPTYPEEESDFSYLAKLSEAYKSARREKQALELNEEKKERLADMQRELVRIGRSLLSYYEREEKKELAVFLMKNAQAVLRSVGEEEAAEETETTPSFSRAVLLANRSLDLIHTAKGCGELSHMILAETSALLALATIG